jgi:N-carbamoylputrescine amidase
MPASVDRLVELSGKLNELRAANLAHHLDLIAAAASVGVRAVGLGELFSGPYFALEENPLWLDLAESPTAGPTVVAMAEAAAQFGMVIVAPLFELDPQSGRRFNSAVVLDADGTNLGRYRKNHIPAGRNERASFHETFYYGPGTGAVVAPGRNLSSNPHFPVFETAVGPLGVAICYDRHFPGVMKALADNGARLVFSPAVTFGATSRRMWELEFAVDAARHGIFIAGSNRLGAEPPWTVEYYGGSGFWGPLGKVEPLSDLGVAPQLIIADLALGAAGSASGWDLERDARPEIY